MISIIMETKKGGPLGSKAFLSLFRQKSRRKGWRGEFINLLI
jgi:hypothetical protein